MRRDMYLARMCMTLSMYSGNKYIIFYLVLKTWRSFKLIFPSDSKTLIWDPRP